MSSSNSASHLPIIKVNEEKSGATFIIPGYGYDDIDRFGHVGAHKVARMSEGLRVMFYNPKLAGPTIHLESDQYRDMMEHLFKSGVLFMMTAVYNFTPALYDNAHMYNRIRASDTLVNIGNTSYQHLTSMTSEKTGQLLVESLSRIVFADEETRRPKQLPEVVKNLNAKKVDSEKLELFIKPSKSHKVKYRVVWSDTDQYRHTNQATYIRICMDGIVEVGLRGVFDTLTGDIGRYWVKAVKCYFQLETNPTDELDIHVFQNTSNPYVVHAVIEKDGTSVFQCTTEFTEPIPSAKI